eukprot:624361-Alexandrium_andersonii.AAC.1
MQPRLIPLPKRHALLTLASHRFRNVSRTKPRFSSGATVRRRGTADFMNTELSRHSWDSLTAVVIPTIIQVTAEVAQD